MGECMIKAVIFDMDGTLVDTESLGVRAWKAAARDLGLDLPDSVMMGFIGRTLSGVLEELAKLYGNERDAERLWRRHKKLRDEWVLQDLPLKPGATECLDELAERGYHLGLATSSRRETAERNLRLVGLFDKFETVTCGDEVVNGKPDPEMYLLACERAGAAPTECAVVEDSRNGCVAGIAAGAHVFAVPDLVPLPQEVKDGAEAILGTLSEVPAAVEALG